MRFVILAIVPVFMVMMLMVSEEDWRKRNIACDICAFPKWKEIALGSWQPHPNELNNNCCFAIISTSEVEYESPTIRYGGLPNLLASTDDKAERSEKGLALFKTFEELSKRHKYLGLGCTVSSLFGNLTKLLMHL